MIVIVLIFILENSCLKKFRLCMINCINIMVCNLFFIYLKYFIILFWLINLKKFFFGFVNIKVSLSLKVIWNGFFGNILVKVKLKVY